MFIEVGDTFLDGYGMNNSRPLRSFGLVHLLKTFQVINQMGRVSRITLSKELELGEGTIRSLLAYLKQRSLVESSVLGTVMTRKAKFLFSGIMSLIPAETSLSGCGFMNNHTYAIIVKNMHKAIKMGIEQRDTVIKSGAAGALTILYESDKFLFPQSKNALENNVKMIRTLTDSLNPSNGDVIIIAWDNKSNKRAEFAAKNAALATILGIKGRRV